MKVLKWIGIIVGIFFVLTVILVIASSGSKNSSVSKSFQEGMNQAKQDVNATPDQKIKDAVTAAVDKNTLKDVQVTKQVDGGYGVLISTNASDGLSNSQIKTGIQMDDGAIYTALYKNPMDVNEVSIVTYGSTSDKYGNSNNTVVMKTSLDKAEAAKVNWNQAQSTLDQNILPNVWTVDEINPSLK